MSTSLYEQAYEQWIAYTASHNPSQLSDILDDEVVFHSPVVFTPQKGKNITFLYLRAATQVLKGFQYTQQIRENNQWALRFEGTIDDIKVIGLDLITVNDEGKIINFEVLVRPAKAVMAIQQAMAQMLDKLKGGLPK
ncbi:MAG: nuclear transport factor 2 family protein [Bacteroidota bacterium]